MAADLDALPALPVSCPQVLPLGWIRYTANQMHTHAAEFALTTNRGCMAALTQALAERDALAAQVAQLRAETLEEAAKLVEAMRDPVEAKRAEERVHSAIDREDVGDEFRALRHASSVGLFNGALERAAKAIRALGGAQTKGAR